MGVLLQDPGLRKQLAGVLQAAEAKVAQLAADLGSAQQEVDALRQLLGANREVLTGDSLRAQLVSLLKKKDPQQAGMHYQVLTNELLAAGYDISGRNPDKAPNVRAHLSHGPEALRLFAPVGKNKGLYTWR